jgi:hypothetical protein
LVGWLIVLVPGNEWVLNRWALQHGVAMLSAVFV